MVALSANKIVPRAQFLNYYPKITARDGGCYPVFKVFTLSLRN